MTGVAVSSTLRQARSASADGRSWLADLPRLVQRARERWHLRAAGAPYDGGACAWVCPARRGDGSLAVVKITWPHPEAAGEAAALRRWNGDGAIRLLEDDPGDWAMLLEHCAPGTPLRESRLTPTRRLEVGAEVLRRLWAAVDAAPTATFDTLAERASATVTVASTRRAGLREALARLDVDPGVINAGLELWRTLPASAGHTVVLHGDLNPGNVLAAERRAYLAIDPKPLLGDAAYDPWPLVAQVGWPPPEHDTAGRPAPEPERVLTERIRRAADLLGVPGDRIAAWGLARDVDTGLWLMSQGHHAQGADWIRAAGAVIPLIG